MSEEGSFGLALVERFFGLIILVTGIVSSYYTFTSGAELYPFVGLFGFLSIILLVLGLVLITAKIE